MWCRAEGEQCKYVEGLRVNIMIWDEMLQL